MQSREGQFDSSVTLP
nr:unnamed protein product [Callosobruchus chinensis]CAH7717846.1 unnamed protein product [Callosobruchus chinensis]CAH7725723.1 unnamed protein product [Callosobruchus chinensis]CAH7727338.1 unnamed protein product [Callosobruchus chinensis]CAH7728780.1 unnamed protein product [Callosobruchus chinensis]